MWHWLFVRTFSRCGVSLFEEKENEHSSTAGCDTRLDCTDVLLLTRFLLSIYIQVSSLRRLVYYTSDLFGRHPRGFENFSSSPSYREVHQERRGKKNCIISLLVWLTILLFSISIFVGHCCKCVQ